MKNLILVLLCAFLVFGCDTLTDMLGMGDEEPLDTPAGFTSTAGHEEIILSWTAVPEADIYTLFYTSDGTKPTTTSDSITDIVTTSYTHSDLDASKTYTYGLVARNDDAKSEMAISTPVQPEIVWNFDVTFSTPAYASGKAVIYIWEDDEAALSGDTSGASREEKKVVDISAEGKVKEAFDVFRNRYYAYTIFYDADKNGYLSTGDEVWSDEGGSGIFGYSYFDQTFTYSHNTTIAEWEKKSSTTPSHSTYVKQ